MKPLHALRDAKSADGVSVFDLPDVVFDVVPMGEGWSVCKITLVYNGGHTAEVRGFNDGKASICQGRHPRISEVFASEKRAVEHMAELYAQKAFALLKTTGLEPKAVNA